MRIAAACVALVCAAAGWAQDVTGTIVGNVTDPSGASVPGARITVTATDRNLAVRMLESDANGEFVAALLPVGRYALAVDAKGFKRLVKTGIVLRVGEKLTFPMSLEVGDIAEEVTVQANALQVELQSATAAGSIAGAEVRELALNDRNYLSLLLLMPGVTSDSDTDEIANVLTFNINGSRSNGNNYMVDGADNVDRGGNDTLLNTPSVDAIAEVKVLRGVYSAEYGRGGAGQINVLSRSGVTQFHGGAHEFLRNDLLAANDFFLNRQEVGRPPLRYNTFGYTFSGPIFIPRHYNTGRNKTFFFWSQEFRRVITYTVLQALAPTDEMKQGIFSAPVCVQYTGSTCTQTASRIQNINPVAAAYIKDIWSKIPAGDPASFSLFTPARDALSFTQELIKIDHVFGPKLALSGRYVVDAIDYDQPDGYVSSSQLLGVAPTSTQLPGRGWVFRATSSFSKTLVNEAGFAYSYGAKRSNPVGLISSAVSPDIQVTLPYPSTLARVPGLNISGASVLNGYGPYFNFSRNYNLFDNLTEVLGRHTLKFGGTFNYYQKNENNASTNAGMFTFASTPRPASTPVLLQGWANFLLGNAATFTQTSLDLTPDLRQRQFELYAQDDFRVRPNLTLNLGARYSQFRLPYDDRHMLTNFDPLLFDPAQAPQVARSTGNIVAGSGNPLNGIIQNKASNQPGGRYAPRVGFAWDPFGKGTTSIRSGYGIAFDSTQLGIYESNIFSNPPFLNNITISNTRLENPSAGVTVVSTAPRTLRGTPLPATIPYTQQWSFDVQHQLWASFILDAGYYGSKSTHLLGMVDINTVPPGWAVAAGIVNARTPITSSTTPLLNILRPYPGYASIDTVENWFNSNYHSLQVAADKRFGRYSMLRLAYTWSKTLTDAGSDTNHAPQNVYDRAADYARAPFDRAQVLTVSYIYELPFKRNALIRGWQLAGTTTFVAGLPLRVTSGLGLDWGGLGLLTSVATPRPDCVANPNTGAPRNIAKWFNTAAFAPVPTGQIRPGDAAATSVIGPGYQQWDVSLYRNIVIRERARLQIRGESYNFFNHANYSGVSTALGATNFGQITSTRDPRRVQLGMKLDF